MNYELIHLPGTKIDDHYCIQEARLSTIETKLENKKESINEINSDYYHLRDKLEIISENVVELATLMREAKKKEEDNDKKIEELQVEIAKINSSLDTLKWLIPIACTILTFIVNYLI